MGNCGKDQVAAGQPPLGSHGLCPYFYTSAFVHRFAAIAKPSTCKTANKRDISDVLLLDVYKPKMGYFNDENAL